MINVSRGPLGLYAPVFDGKLEPTIVIADFPLKWTVAAMAPLFDTGINAVIAAPSESIYPHIPKIINTKEFIKLALCAFIIYFYLKLQQFIKFVKWQRHLQIWFH